MRRYRLTKQFYFSAAHSLPHLPSDHKCHRLHGHNYIVEVVLEASHLDERGFAVADYAELDVMGDYLNTHLDHRNLNEILTQLGGYTTAECLANHLLSWCEEFIPAIPIIGIRVSETPSTWVECWRQ